MWQKNYRVTDEAELRTLPDKLAAVVSFFDKQLYAKLHK